LEVREVSGQPVVLVVLLVPELLAPRVGQGVLAVRELLGMQEELLPLTPLEM
jgi:hypothetical protein